MMSLQILLLQNLYAYLMRGIILISSHLMMVKRTYLLKTYFLLQIYICFGKLSLVTQMSFKIVVVRRGESVFGRGRPIAEGTNPSDDNRTESDLAFPRVVVTPMQFLGRIASQRVDVCPPCRQNSPNMKD